MSKLRKTSHNNKAGEKKRVLLIAKDKHNELKESAKYEILFKHLLLCYTRMSIMRSSLISLTQ